MNIECVKKFKELEQRIDNLIKELYHVANIRIIEEKEDEKNKE